jgi:hypothetical protein
LAVSRLPVELQLCRLLLNRGQPSFPLAPILDAQGVRPFRFNWLTALEGR